MTENSLPVLYSFKRCPYAIRARVALAFAQINHIHREIDLKNKHPDFLKLSPKGTVPVLELPEQNNTLEESYDIVVFALNHHLPNQWQSNHILDTEEVQSLYRNLNEEAIPAIRRIKYASMYKENTSLEDTTIINSYLKTLDQKLGTNTSILTTPSAIDILIFPNLRQLVIHDDGWLDRYEFKNIKNWIRHWTENVVFKRIFVNQPLWSKEQKPIIIDNKQKTNL
ncbi:MAG: glutathione S-transferase family protein [Pseudomonadota bacterium]|nr:glutathione S-transferase family protein [Pseudomonadota bacterium]